MATPSSVTLHGGSYVEWSAVIAGSVLACAVSLVLLQFGGGLGFTAADTLSYAGENRTWRIIVVGLWLLWVQLMASLAGGYLAGRMRAPMENAAAHESEMRDGMHGLLVWATSTLLAFAGAVVASVLGTMANEAGLTPDVAAQTQIPAEVARNSGIVLGFAAAAASVVSAVAAWWIATLGGEHRDQAVDASRYVSFRRRG